MTQKQYTKTNIRIKKSVPLSDAKALLIAQSLTPEEQNENHQQLRRQSKGQFKFTPSVALRGRQQHRDNTLKAFMNERSKLRIDRTHISQRTSDTDLSNDVSKANTSTKFEHSTKEDSLDLTIFALDIKSDSENQSAKSNRSHLINNSVELDSNIEDNAARFNLLELAL